MSIDIDELTERLETVRRWSEVVIQNEELPLQEAVHLRVRMGAISRNRVQGNLRKLEEQQARGRPGSGASRERAFKIAQLRQELDALNDHHPATHNC
jgi:hypothetical protein